MATDIVALTAKEVSGTGLHPQHSSALAKINEVVARTNSQYVEGEDITIKLYSQNAEPTLDADGKAALWKDTDDSDKIYLVFRRGSGDQVKIQLT